MSSSVSHQARRGMFSLLGRQAIVFPINLVAGILLARLLAPADFGAYATATFLVMSAGALLDLGLGAVLVQQADEPSPRQLRSIFTAQVGIFALATALVFGLAPLLAAAFKLPPGGEWLLRATALHMILGCFGTISTLLLERRLRFGVFARLDIVHILLERGLTLGLAFAGFGVWSFVWGSLTAIAVRTALLFVAAPWRIGLAFDRTLVLDAARFGVFFQGSNLVMLARDNMNALLGGPLFGPRFVGYLNWGQNLAGTCSHVFVQVLGRVTFPAFSRLHDRPEERQSLLAGSLVALNHASYPVLAIVVVVAPALVTHLYGEAWRPAIPVLACFCWRMAGTNVTSLLINYLNAVGQVRRAFRIAAVWTVLEWTLALALVPLVGFMGVAYAYAAGVLVPVAWLLWGLRDEVPLPWVRAFAWPALAAAAGALVAWALLPAIGGIVTLVAVMGVSWLVSLVGIGLAERAQIGVLLARLDLHEPVQARTP